MERIELLEIGFFVELMKTIQVRHPIELQAEE